jgi:hypothetical protein
MMDTTTADSWILCSITLAANPTASLSEVVGVADHLNCTIPTLDEMNGALVRLTDAGLVEVHDQRMAATAPVHRFWATCRELPARQVFDKFGAFLRSWPSYSPDVPVERTAFSGEDLKAACEEHRRDVQKQMRRRS